MRSAGWRSTSACGCCRARRGASPPPKRGSSCWRACVQRSARSMARFTGWAACGSVRPGACVCSCRARNDGGGGAKAGTVLTRLSRGPARHHDGGSLGRPRCGGLRRRHSPRRVHRKDMVAVRVSKDHEPIIVGARAYFESRPKPRSPQELTSHRCINFRHGSGEIYRWEFEKDGRSLAVAVTGPLIVDDVEPRAARGARRRRPRVLV